MSIQWRRIAIGTGLGLAAAAGALLLSSAPAAADDGLLSHAALSSAANAVVHPLVRTAAKRPAPSAARPGVEPLAAGKALEPHTGRPGSTAGRPARPTGGRQASRRPETPIRRAGIAIHPAAAPVLSRVATTPVPRAVSTVVRPVGAVADRVIAPIGSHVAPVTRPVLAVVTTSARKIAEHVAVHVIGSVVTPLLEPVRGAVLEPDLGLVQQIAFPPRLSGPRPPPDNAIVAAFSAAAGATDTTAVARDGWARTVGASPAVPLPGPAQPARRAWPAPEQAMPTGAGSLALAATASVLAVRPPAASTAALRRTAHAPLEAAYAPGTRPG